MITRVDRSGIDKLFTDWHGKVMPRMEEAVHQGMSRFHRRIHDHRLSNSGAGSINSRRLRRALKTETKQKGANNIVGRTFFRGHWADVAEAHEYGYRIRARRSPKKWLTIPLDAAKQKKNSRGNVPRARRFPNTFVAKSKSGKLFIWQAKKPLGPKKPGKKKKKKFINPGAWATPLFILKKSIKLKARLNFYKDWNRVGKPEAWKIIRATRDRLCRELSA